MTTIRFNVQRRRMEVKTFCRKCKKKLVRVVLVEHTVNPWNRNDRGEIRTPGEVYECVRQEAQVKADKLRVNGTTCQRCEQAAAEEKG